MRRTVIFAIIVLLVFLSGCTLPVNKNSDADDGVKPDRAVVPDEGDFKKETKAAESERQSMTVPEEKPGAEAADARKEESRQKLAVTLYYQDKQGHVFPVTRRIVKQEGIARAAVNGIIDSAINREELEYYGLYPILPAGTEILGISIKEATAVIDFNKKLLDYQDEVAERNIVSSVVYTLTEFKTINGVKILIDGHAKGKLKYGTDISGVLNRENTMVNSDRVNIKKGSGKIDIYMFKSVSDIGPYMLPLSVEIEKVDGEDIPGRLVEFLGSNSKYKELYSEVPPGTRLISSSIKGSTLTLNFDKGLIRYGGGTAREEGVLNQILHCARQIKGIDKVKILIEGKAAELPEGTDISKEIPLPSVINDIIDK